MNLVVGAPMTVDAQENASQSSRATGFIRLLGVGLFGIILPLCIAWGVGQRIESAHDFVTRQADNSFIKEKLDGKGWKPLTANDYALLALADSERANLAVTINKQVMKIVVIYMGFAVMSFGIMFIVLGFTDGPVRLDGAGAGMTLNVQFSSVGAAVFVLGAAMSAGGGLLRNEYRTVGLPQFRDASGTPKLQGRVGEVVGQCSAIATEDGQRLCIIALLQVK